MSSAKRWLADLYHDLRDRRLLPVVAVLLVAIVAVPVALSTGSGSPPPSSGASGPTSAAGGGTDEAAVRAEVGASAVRDWRKRLGELKRKNPFRQPFSLSGGGSLDGTLPETVGETVAIGGESGVATGDEAATGDTGTETSTPTSVKTATETATETVVKEQTKLVSHKIAVKVGPVGDLERRKRVGELDLLPSASIPMVVFLGVSESGKRAFFLVSSDVAGTDGDGKCLLSASDCELLLLREGESEDLDYAAGGADDGTYRLKLLDIRRVLKNAR